MSTDLSVPVSYLSADRTVTSSQPNDRLDSEAFLGLLMAQLRNQDPSKPADSETILTQTVQLATMESLSEQISTARESFALQMRAAAAALVGQRVSWRDAEGADHEGGVSAVSYTGAVPTLRVGDDEVALDLVRTLSLAD